MWLDAYLHVASVELLSIVVEADIVLSASCVTLSSTFNVTMFANMLVVAMVSSASERIPAGYVTVIGADNSCIKSQHPGSRHRSLFQNVSGSSSSTSSQQKQQQQSSVDSGEDGTATVKIAVIWPGDVVASTGLTSAQAALMVANSTSPRALSSIFTISFMAAYNIRFTPSATIKVLSTDHIPQLLTSLEETSATTTRGMFQIIHSLA